MSVRSVKRAHSVLCLVIFLGRFGKALDDYNGVFLFNLSYLLQTLKKQVLLNSRVCLYIEVNYAILKIK